ncbi:MAG: hypothetical protein IJF87_05835 [Erysipelotrichaceae bacterium]|nr:hypothetical protein [Erysipelotrichaceae bacterium]
MNRYPQDVYATVEAFLRTCPETRDSDVALYKKVLMYFYKTTDLSEINLDGDIFSSIKRSRQKIQQINPYLGPSREVKLKRKNMENKYLDFVRNW